MNEGLGDDFLKRFHNSDEYKNYSNLIDKQKANWEKIKPKGYGEQPQSTSKPFSFNLADTFNKNKPNTGTPNYFPKPASMNTPTQSKPTFSFNNMDYFKRGNPAVNRNFGMTVTHFNGGANNSKPVPAPSASKPTSPPPAPKPAPPPAPPSKPNVVATPASTAPKPATTSSSASSALQQNLMAARANKVAGFRSQAASQAGSNNFFGVHVGGLGNFGFGKK